MQNRDDGEVSQCNSIVHDASYYFQTKVKYGLKLMIFGLLKKKKLWYHTHFIFDASVGKSLKIIIS